MSWRWIGGKDAKRVSRVGAAVTAEGSSGGGGLPGAQTGLSGAHPALTPHGTFTLRGPTPAVFGTLPLFAEAPAITTDLRALRDGKQAHLSTRSGVGDCSQQIEGEPTMKLYPVPCKPIPEIKTTPYQKPGYITDAVTGELLRTGQARVLAVWLALVDAKVLPEDAPQPLDEHGWLLSAPNNEAAVATIPAPVLLNVRELHPALPVTA